MSSFGTVETTETATETSTVVLHHCVRNIQTNDIDQATGHIRTTNEQVILSRTDSTTTTTKTITIKATFSVPVDMDIDLDDDKMEELIIMMRNLSLQ